MGLIPAIISAAGEVVRAAIVKVIADDAKEWTPWVTRRLLAIAVRRLPESKRERYAEEWAAHLAEIPGVTGKLAVSLQFQIAALCARELDARARLAAWRQERAAFTVTIRALAAELLPLADRAIRAKDVHTREEYRTAMVEAIMPICQIDRELEARRPALGITLTGASFMAEHIGSLAYARVIVSAVKARNRFTSMRRHFRDGEVLRRLQQAWGGLRPTTSPGGRSPASGDTTPATIKFPGQKPCATHRREPQNDHAAG